MNAELSSSSNEHYTPIPLVQLCRKVLTQSDSKPIGLDPFTTELVNTEVINAKKYFTETDNAFDQDWITDTVFCNPPGGRTKNGRSMIKASWNKMYDEYAKGNFKSGIFIGFNLEIISKVGSEILDLPVCVPQPLKSSYINGMGRIKFDAIKWVRSSNSYERFSQDAPTHGNIIVLLPSRDEEVAQTTLFKALFNQYVGKVVIPQ
jgi:hypothetical protein